MPVSAQTIARAAAVRPSPRQLAWQRNEYIAFAHFGINTFTDREWGEGQEDPRLFNPTSLDCNQWARVCRDAGMRMIILTAKHHDGFCLWPSRFTDHSVRSSPWRGGKADVVAELARACADAGLKLGLYLSPWDRHERSYGDSPRYNEFYRNQLTELLTNYGPVAEVWFDGACGEGPNGKRQVYDWASYYAVVRKLQPDAVIFNGPDVRWVGNESGLARDTEWSVVPLQTAKGERIEHNFVDFNHQAPDLGSRGVIHDGQDFAWYPAETDVSIRPGWFYHAHEDDKVKSLPALLDIYYQSLGRNSVLLLNLPPDRRGLIHENDAARLRELRRAIDATFANDFAADARVVAEGRTHERPPAVIRGDAEFALRKPAAFDRLMLREDIAQGQLVDRYALDAWVDGEWRTVTRGTTIGYQKLDRFPVVTADRVRLRVVESRATPSVSRVGLFKAAE